MLYVSLDNADTVIEGGPHHRGSITPIVFLTSTEITGGAPLLALFEKWPPEQASPLGREPRENQFWAVLGLLRMARILYVSDCVFFPSRLTTHCNFALSP